MKKFLLAIALLLSLVAMSAMIPTNSDAYRVVYGPTWGYYSGWGYPATPMVMVGVTGTHIGQGEYITKPTPGAGRTEASTTAGRTDGTTINQGKAKREFRGRLNMVPIRLPERDRAWRSRNSKNNLDAGVTSVQGLVCEPCESTS